jgi:hypothetical protein
MEHIVAYELVLRIPVGINAQERIKKVAVCMDSMLPDIAKRVQAAIDSKGPINIEIPVSKTVVSLGDFKENQ